MWHPLEVSYRLVLGLVPGNIGPYRGLDEQNRVLSTNFAQIPYNPVTLYRDLRIVLNHWVLYIILYETVREAKIFIL